MAITAGTPGGFPIDFGITEGLSSLFGTQIGAYNPNQGAPAIGPESIQDVQITPIAPIPASTASSGTYVSAPTSSTNTGGSTTSTAPSPSGDVGTTDPTPTGPSQEEIDSVFNPQFDFLNQAESALKADQPNALAEAEAQYGLNKQIAETGKTQSLGAVEGQETKTQNRKESALDAANRLFQELGIGNRQRFGGASSAGRAMSELQGRELQRNRGDITAQAEEAFKELSGQRVKIEQDHQNTMLQLQVQRQNAINQINRDFQNKLLEISRLRNEAESAKAQMRLDALQALRNQVFAIELQNKQFEQQLALQRANSLGAIDTQATQLASAVNQATNTTQQFGANTSTNPTSQYNLGDLSSPTAGASAQLVPVGQVTPKKDENLNPLAI